MIARLIWIETRRNVARWLVPVILLVAWWMLSARGWIPILWSSTNDLLQESVIPFAVPALAGAAAWMAGRERRRGTQDLLATTPAAPLSRSLSTWASTAIWGIVACTIFAAVMMSWTALVAAWGGPELPSFLSMLTSILAFSAWGYAIGVLAPSRFTAPAVAVGAFGVVLYLTNYMSEVSSSEAGSVYQETWITYLAPDKTRVESAHWHALLYFGLAGAALAVLALSYRRRVPAAMFLIGSLVVAGTGAGMIRHEWIHNHNAVIVPPGGPPPALEPAEEQAPPVQVCEGDPVTVCVHPKYEPLLDDAVAATNRLAEPLSGLPDVPQRAGPHAVHFTGGATRSIFELGQNASLDVSNFASHLVADESIITDAVITNPAQIAMRSWLLQRADIDSHWRCDNPRFRSWETPGMPTSAGMTTRETCAATAHFAALTSAEQRAWLEANYVDLRAGRLTLEDLPPNS